MRIVYLYTSLTTVGGADRILTIKANYLAEKMGYEVYLITDSQQQQPFAFPLSSLVKHIDLNINFSNQYKYPVYIRYFIYSRLMQLYKKRLTKILLEIKPQIVINTLGRDMDFLTTLNDGSKKVGESHISKEFIRNFHLMEEKGGIHKMIAQSWRKKQEKAIKQLDAFVVLTKQDALNWESVRSSVIIPNPLTLSTDTVAKCNSKKVISVGRYSEQKGYDILIKAWKLVNEKHPDWELIIYGEGELKPYLEQEIELNQLNTNVILHPPVSNIVDKYLESAFYVMSSRFEGFGLVLTEAMLCGLPCISFDCPSGPREIIAHNEDGLLVENGNISKLVEAICYFIENEDTRKEMGKKATQNMSRYGKPAIMKKWDELFNSLQ